MARSNKNNPRPKGGGRRRRTAKKRVIDRSQSRHIAQLCNNSAVVRSVPRDPPSVSNTMLINKILVMEVTTVAPAGVANPTPMRPGVIRVAGATPSGVVSYTNLLTWLATTLGFTAVSAQTAFTNAVSTICLNNISIWGPSASTENAAAMNVVTAEIPPLTNGESGAVINDSGGRGTRARTGLSPVKRYWVNPGDAGEVAKPAFIWSVGPEVIPSVAGVSIGTLHISVTVVLGPTRSTTLVARPSVSSIPMEEGNAHIPMEAASSDSSSHAADGSGRQGSLRQNRFPRPSLTRD